MNVRTLQKSIRRMKPHYLCRKMFSLQLPTAIPFANSLWFGGDRRFGYQWIYLNRSGFVWICSCAIYLCSTEPTMIKRWFRMVRTMWDSWNRWTGKFKNWPVSYEIPFDEWMDEWDCLNTILWRAEGGPMAILRAIFKWGSYGFRSPTSPFIYFTTHSREKKNKCVCLSNLSHIEPAHVI